MNDPDLIYARTIASRDFARSTIEYEGGLNNSRVSWLVSSQAFLLGTYAVLLNAPHLHLLSPGESMKFSSVEGATFNAQMMDQQVAQLRFWFAYIGLGLSLVTSFTVFAGYRALLQRNENFMQGPYQQISASVREWIDPPLVGKTRRIFGILALMVGPLFTLVWIGIIAATFRIQDVTFATWCIFGSGNVILAGFFVYFVTELKPVTELGQWKGIARFNNKYIRGTLRRQSVVIVGKGPMSMGVRDCLVKIGHKVLVVDSRHESLPYFKVVSGGPLVDPSKLTKLAKHARLLIVLLPDDDAVRNLFINLETHNLVNKSKCVIVNHSTISPTYAVELAKWTEEKGFRYIEMPVTGGTSGAKTGSLSGFYACRTGAGNTDYRNALLYLNCYFERSKLIRLDCFGDPAKFKMVNQIGIAGALLASVESLAVAKSLNLPLNLALRILKSGAADSWSMQHHGVQMVEGNYELGISLSTFLKDINYVESTVPAFAELVATSRIKHLLNETIDELEKIERGSSRNVSSPRIFETFCRILDSGLKRM